MLLFSSCSGVKTAGEIMDAETAYNAGVKAFLDEDYFEAQRLFDVIRLQFPTTQYADDAQFYLGEISFAKKEYVMAAFNFGMVRRSYPSSPLNKTALYKTAMCYFKQFSHLIHCIMNQEKRLMSYEIGLPRES
jgi:TolA-binding protein